MFNSGWISGTKQKKVTKEMHQNSLITNDKRYWENIRKKENSLHGAELENFYCVIKSWQHCHGGSGFNHRLHFAFSAFGYERNWPHDGDWQLTSPQPKYFHVSSRDKSAKFAIRLLIMWFCSLACCSLWVESIAHKHLYIIYIQQDIRTV